jgi:tripartite-type tricarboxylate transporter receptor subunit TctC
MRKSFREGTMKLPRRRFLHLAASIAGLPVVPHLARAQAYPTRPLTMIVGYGVGGPTDTIARIPTVDEAGLQGFYISLWWGLWAPKGTSSNLIAKLNDGVTETLADPAVRARIADQGLEIPTREQQTPEALAAFQKAEIDRWWPIVKAAGIKGE